MQYVWYENSKLTLNRSTLHFTSTCTMPCHCRNISKHILFASCITLQELPSYDERRALLARDPLACAEGFRTLVMLTLRHVFGVRYCPDCPNCAQSDRPCMDAFGSNATAKGGIFGRIDAIYGSIECQKSGSLHLHTQAFVQCYHQFTPLSELVTLSSERQLELLRRYSTYSAHVRRTIYNKPQDWEEEQQDVEADWPEYKGCALMVSRPAYQSADAASMTAEEWKLAFLTQDVEELQKRKQHHVHLPSGPNGERQPLNHCKDAKDPTKCKGGFPRDGWLTDELLLICPQLAEDMEMPRSGKRTMVGMPWGPCNNASLNGNHPAMLAAQRCNGDVQLPYRFPITDQVHAHSCKGCDEDCDKKVPIWELAKAAQNGQSAQAGYGCDYQNKRHLIAIFEAKEWEKSQSKMIEDIMEEKPGYVGARLSKRLMTDLYGRGVCRGAVECTNLVLHAEKADPTLAESIKTAPVTDITLAYPLRLLAEIKEGQRWPQEPRRQQTDLRVHTRPKLVDCPFWTVYGGRGCLPQAGRAKKMWCVYIFTLLHSTVHTSSVGFALQPSH